MRTVPNERPRPERQPDGANQRKKENADMTLRASREPYHARKGLPTGAASIQATALEETQLLLCGKAVGERLSRSGGGSRSVIEKNSESFPGVTASVKRIEFA